MSLTSGLSWSDLDALVVKIGTMAPGPARQSALDLLERLREQLAGEDRFGLGDLQIRTKDRRRIRFEPNEVQRAYLDALLPGWQGSPYGLRGIREIILKARQFGFSTLILGLFFLDTVQTPNTQTVVIAHDSESTERLFQMVQRFYNHLPAEQRPRTKYANRREYLWPELDSYFFVGTAGTGEFGRGGTIQNVHGSEVAYWPDAQELVSGLLQSVPLDGNVFLETTANGMGNWFYEEFTKAYEAHDSVFRPQFYAWFRHSEYRLPGEPLVRTLEEEGLARRYDLDDEQLRWRRLKVKELREKFVQEYPANAAEAFIASGGRVLSEFIAELAPAGHLVPDFIPPRSWRHYLVIDPGWNTFAALFAAVDPDGRLWLYGEYYLGERRPADHLAALHEYWQLFGCPHYDVIMDSAGFDKLRAQTGQESPSWASELTLAAIDLGASWFLVRKCTKADPLALRPKRYFATDMLRVCDGLRWFRWEAARWVRQAPRKGRAASEKPDPEAPIDRYNHLCDCLRYLCNELPDPLEIETAPKTALEEHWARLEDLRRLAQADQKEGWN